MAIPIDRSYLVMLAKVRTPNKSLQNDVKHILHHNFTAKASEQWYGIPETRVQVLVKKHVFHINKSCFQLEDNLASGSSRSPNLG